MLLDFNYYLTIASKVKIHIFFIIFVPNVSCSMYRFKFIYETLNYSDRLYRSHLIWTAAITIIKCKIMYIKFSTKLS